MHHAFAERAFCSKLLHVLSLVIAEFSPQISGGGKLSQ